MSVRATTQAWAWIAAGKAQTAAEKLVLLRLADHVCDETKEAFPSSRHLAKMTGLGRATVQRSIKSLDERAFRVERRKSRYGDDAVSLFHWLLDGWPQDEATPTMEAGEKEEGSGPMVRPGVASPSSQGGLTQQPEPSLNHQTKPPQPVVDGATDNQNPTPAIDFPSQVPNEARAGLLAKLSLLDQQQQRDVLAALAAKLERAAAGQSGPINDIQAYAVGLIRKAESNKLDVSQSVVAARQSTELDSKLSAIRAGIDGGGCLYVDDEEAPVDVWPLAKLSNGHANIAALIKRGAKVEVRHV